MSKQKKVIPLPQGLRKRWDLLDYEEQKSLAIIHAASVIGDGRLPHIKAYKKLLKIIDNIHLRLKVQTLKLSKKKV